jgi:hypothetical protein
LWKQSNDEEQKKRLIRIDSKGEHGGVLLSEIGLNFDDLEISLDLTALMLAYLDLSD